MKTKKKILTVIGARPQFIKAAAVSRELDKYEALSEVVVHTGQHYDHNMSEVFFREMKINEPKYNLGIKSSLQGEMTGRMIAAIEQVILVEKPDAVMVYGDTNSTLAGAIASVKLHVPLVHVEAGMRSYNLDMPEEVNRILTDRVSSLLFCPTGNAVNNLLAEGFDNFPCKYMLTGDVMLDAFLYYSKLPSKPHPKLGKLKDFILCTIHRAENTNDPSRMKNIVSAINKINKEMQIVFPMHPRTKKTVEALGLKLECTVIDPVGYLGVINLLKTCSLVMTDSGGLQKESYFFKKPCICVRNETEWTELSEANYLVLTGSDEKKILQAFKNHKKMNSSYKENFFGDGNACAMIAEELLR